jgi:hypothetical protein
MVHILSDAYSTLNSFWQFYIPDTVYLDGLLKQHVVLSDDGSVRPEACTCRRLV